MKFHLNKFYVSRLGPPKAHGEQIACLKPFPSNVYKDCDPGPSDSSAVLGTLHHSVRISPRACPLWEAK